MKSVGNTEEICKEIALAFGEVTRSERLFMVAYDSEGIEVVAYM